MNAKMQRSPELSALVLELQRALIEIHVAGELVKPLDVECILQSFREAQCWGHSVEFKTISPKGIRRSLV